MDALDIAILGELFRAPRAPYGTVGERVGLSANAVKARLARLRSMGVLRGFAAAPDPALLGMVEGLIVFSNVEDLDEREAEVLANLPDVPGVRFVDVTVERSVHVWLAHKDEADWERIERAAISLVGKPPAFSLHEPRREAAEPTANDWRLLRALVPDARATVKDLARRSGMSIKTAKRRLTALLTAGQVRLEPVLSPGEASGMVLYSLSAVLKENARVSDVLALLPENAIAQTRPGSRLVTFHVARDTLREAQADHRAVKASAHVEHVLFGLGTRRRADAWLDDAVAARLRALVTQPIPPTQAPVPIPRSK